MLLSFTNHPAAKNPHTLSYPHQFTSYAKTLPNMEPKTSSSSTTRTFPAMVLKHGEPSMHDLSLISPAFSPTPSPGLLPVSGSRSGSSWYQQIPLSPAMASGNGSLYVHEHTASSQSLTSSFPKASTLPMVAYDLFGNPKMRTATPLPTLLRGQQENGESFSKEAFALRECPSSGLCNFSGFVQPSSSSVLSPLVPIIHGPLLPVKQEVMDSGSSKEYVNATPCCHSAGFVSPIVDDEEDRYNIFGSWGSSNPTSFAPSSWLGSSSDNPIFVPHNWSYVSSSSPGMAPSSWIGNSSGSTSFAPSRWSGHSSNSSSLSFAPSRWGNNNNNPSFARSTPCFNQSTSIDISPMIELSMGGKMSSTSDLPPLPRIGASNNKENGSIGIVFTNPEKAIIAKDKKLQELLRTDLKKVKRILYNRAYSAMKKVRNVMHTKNLERLVVTLEERRKSLCAELQLLEEVSAALTTQNMEMQMIIGELEKNMMLKDAVREGLRDEIENLKHLKLIN